MGLLRGARRALLGGAPRIRYLLRDEFKTARAAGAVHGTAAEPGPGTRSLTDTTDKISVANGRLAVLSGGPSATDPRMYYSDMPISRVAGRVLLCKFYKDAVGNRCAFGFDDAQDRPSSAGFAIQNVHTSVFDNNSAGPSAWATVIDVWLDLAIVLRASGVYGFMKGDTLTEWTLLWFGSIDTDATLYAGIASEKAAYYDSIRIPDVLWLPRPSAYDTFTRGDGALGSSETSGPDAQDVTGRTWTFDAGIWTVASNEAKGSPPVTGATLLEIGDMETGDPPAFNATSGAVLDGVADERTGGSGIQSVEVTRGTADNAAYKSTSGDIGRWYKCSAWLKNVDATSLNVIISSFTQGGTPDITGTSWTESLVTGRWAGASSRQVRLYVVGAEGEKGRFDDVVIKALTLSELFASIDDSATSDLVISVDVTLTGGNTKTQAGIVMNLDDETTPANFVIGYHDGINAKLDKCVAGVYTSVIKVAATYGAGNTLLVIKDGNDYSLYYNNAKIGSTSTISDAGIVDNTKHGLFSTHEGNRLDNFTLFPRGKGGEYSQLDDY